MGKMKRRRAPLARSKPSGVLSQRDAAAVEETSTEKVGGVVRNLMEKLQSTSTEEQECACLMIAGLVEQPHATSQLLAAGVIKILAPLILSTSTPSLQVSAAGAIRNLSAMGADCCEAMMKQDVMTPVEALMKQFNGLPNSDGLKGQTTHNLLLNTLHLLWNLCEGSDAAVCMFSRAGLMNHLLPFMNATMFGTDVALAAAQCLYIVTEDNVDTASQMAKDRDQIMPLLHSIMQQTYGGKENTYMLLKVLTTGLLYNLCISPPGDSSRELVANVVEVSAETLAADTSKILAQLCHILSSKQVNEQSTFGDEDVPVEVTEGQCAALEPSGDTDVELPVMDKAIEPLAASACDALTAQQVALEMIANLCCQDTETDEDWEDMSSTESIGDVEVDSEVDMETQVVSDEVPSEIYSLFVEHDLLAKVLAVIEPMDESVLDSLSSSSHTIAVIDSLSELRERALFCLSNLTSSLPLEALGGADNVQRVWTGLSKLVALVADKADVGMLEAATCAMRAATQKLAQVKGNAFANISSSDLQFLASLGRRVGPPEIRANVINIMTTIGQAIAKQQVSPAVIKDVGLFLLSVLTQESVLWVQAEALDGIFDVFGEDHTDDIVRDIGLLDSLRTLAPVLKARVHRERQQLGEHLPIVMTARTNLMRFIKYKMKSMKH